MNIVVPAGDVAWIDGGSQHLLTPVGRCKVKKEVRVVNMQGLALHEGLDD